MADQTLQFTSNTTPDQGGTNSMVSLTNTGYNTTTSNTITNARSCRWSNLQSADQPVVRFVVKGNYSISVTGSAGNLFYIQSSSDNGSSWSDLVRLTNTGNTSGSLNNSIDASTSSNIQIRIYQEITTSASISSSFSSLQVEVDYLHGGNIMMM